jgi:hypothetical protein
MIIDDEQDTQAEVVPVEIMWRNPLSLARAHLRAKERSNPYYGWAEQAKKIRARRANWDVNHCWAA